MPARVDAIVVPGGPGNRLGAALTLGRPGPRTLPCSFARHVHSPEPVRNSCGQRPVICFQPTPDTTQGEAEATARFAKQYRWRSIVLVTTPDQIWRAELRFRRCYSGETYAVSTPLPVLKWPFMIAYQWVATVKAELVNRSC